MYFIDVPERRDELDRVKGWLKTVLGTGYYSVGIRVFGPTYPFNFARKVEAYLDPSSALVVDAGSGNNRLHSGIIGVDMFDYDEVDIVCRLDALPFLSGSVDAFVSRSVLEHIPEPARVLDEFVRCTRPGGFGIHMIPFLFPYHASPGDYHRFTHDGHDVLFRGWEIVERMNPSGPVTVTLAHLLEVLATVLSFNVQRVKPVVYLVLCGILFPVKFLDAPFVNRRAFLGSAASILSVVRKPS